MNKHLIILFLIVQSAVLQATNILKINQYQSLPDAVISVELVAENEDPFVAFQADIPVPAGFKFVENSAILNAARINGHALSVSLLTGNILRLIGYSPNNIAFSGNAGSLLTFSLKTGKTPGTFPLQINEALLGNSQSANILTGAIAGSVTVLAPDIHLSTASLNFSRVALGSQAETGFYIQNNGNQDLIISSLSFDDAQFSTTETANISIAGGSGRYIGVRFAPTTKGNYNKWLYINSNDPDQPVLKVGLEAVAYAVNELHTGSISGASSTSGTLEFAVNNMETFTGIQFDIHLPQPLSYIPGSATLLRRDDHVIAVNTLNSNTLRVLAYSPGNKSFSFNNGKLMELGFQLNGTGGYYHIGISNVLISDSRGENIISAYYSGSLQISSSDIQTSNRMEFGDVSKTSQKEILQTIYNYGQEPLIINQLTFNSAFFSSTQTLPLTIQPYHSANIPLVFKKESKGAAVGIMRIFSNDPDQGIYQVELSGNAFAPNYLKVKPQRIMQGETKELSIEIDNEEAVVAFQFDLTIPQGLHPDLNNISLSDRKTDHLISSILLNNNTLRVICYSPGQKSIQGKSGTMVIIPLQCESEIASGNYEMQFANSVLSNQNAENILYSSVNGTIFIGTSTGSFTIQSADYKIYPNPSTNFVLVEINNNSPEQNFRLIDLMGKSVLEGRLCGGINKIDLTGFVSGVYLLVMNNICSKIVLK